MVATRIKVCVVEGWGKGSIDPTARAASGEEEEGGSTVGGAEGRVECKKEAGE